MRRLAVVAWLCGAIASAAWGTEARVQALGGNPLFDDDLDQFVFPALTAYYGRALGLHVGSAGPQATLVFGDDWKWGVSYGTPLAYRDLAATATELNRPVLAPTPLVSLWAARKLSDTDYLGFGLNPSVAVNRFFPLSPAPITNAVALEFEVLAGYSIRSSSLLSDSAVAVSIHRFQARSGGVTQADTPALPSIALRHRSILVDFFGQKVDLGIYGELARRDESFSQYLPFSSDAAIARYVFNAGVGPRFRPIPQLELGPALEVGYEDVNGGVDTSGFEFSRWALPRLRISAEGSPLPWLFVRASVFREFDVVTRKPQQGGQGDVSSDAFSWNTGVGVVFDKLQVDATVSNALLLEGPAIVGGTSPGLFGSLSVRYSY